MSGETDWGETLVVTGSLTPQLPEEATRSVEVLGPAEIEERPAQSLPDLMAGASGVFIQKTNHAGGAPFIRGLHGQHVLLLVDGIRLNNAIVRNGPNQYLNTVDPFWVERIEVVHGPASVLYGSDAIGGVVNVITREPLLLEGHGGRLRLLHGTADSSVQGHLEAWAGNGTTTVTAGVSGRSFGNLRGGSETGVQRYTGYQEVDVAGKLHHRPGPGERLTLQYQRIRQHAAPRTDRSWPGDFRLFTNQERDFVHARYERSMLGPLLGVQLDLSALRQGERVDRFRVARDLQTATTVEDWTYALRATARLPVGVRGTSSEGLAFGVDATVDRVTSTGSEGPISSIAPLQPFPASARYVSPSLASGLGLFSLLTLSPTEAMELRAGLRGQLNLLSLREDARLQVLFPSAGLQPLPSRRELNAGLAFELGGQYRLGGPVTLVAHLGSGFRSPNVDDYLRLGGEGPGFTLPSDALEPERSYTGEIGLRYARGGLTANALYSFTYVDALIANVPSSFAGQAQTPDGLPFLRRVNGESARVHALELRGGVELPASLRLIASAVYSHGTQRRRDLTLGGSPFLEEPLPKSPPLQGRAALAWSPLGSFGLTLEVPWSLAQRRLAQKDLADFRICPESPGCEGTPGFWVADVRGHLDLGAVLLTATLQNLLDVSYRAHASGIDGPGRSFIVAVEGRL